MADTKLYDLTGLVTPADDDELYINDVSDTTDSDDGSSRKISLSALSARTETLINKTLTSPVINTGISGTAIVDEDDMASDSATKVPTQQSVKAYRDAVHDATMTFTNKTNVQKVTSYTPAAAGTATLNLTTGNIHAITMPAGNITIAISNEAVGQCFMIEITQDDVGSRTVTWFDTIKWADGSAPTLTTTADKRDSFGFRVTGTDTYDGYVVGQNI
jgi:hypothetical protein